MDAQQPLIADPSNAGQVGAWDGSEGAFWTAQARRFDETLANCHGPFLTAAAIRENDRVLDVGCGTGQATRDVARVAVERLRARRRSVVPDDRARPGDRGRRRSRQRRVPTRRRADPPLRERRVRRRDLPHGFDVLRRSNRGIRQPPSRVAPRRSTRTPHLAGRHRQRVAHRVPRRLGRRPRPPDTTPRGPQPVRALRPRSRERHPRRRGLRRHLLPEPSRTDELRTRPRRRVRLRQRVSPAGCATASTKPTETQPSRPCARRSPSTRAITESPTSPRRGSSRPANPDRPPSECGPPGTTFFSCGRSAYSARGCPVGSAFRRNTNAVSGASLHGGGEALGLSVARLRSRPPNAKRPRAFPARNPGTVSRDDPIAGFMLVHRGAYFVAGDAPSTRSVPLYHGQRGIPRKLRRDVGA